MTVRDCRNRVIIGKEGGKIGIRTGNEYETARNLLMISDGRTDMIYIAIGTDSIRVNKRYIAINPDGLHINISKRASKGHFIVITPESEERRF